MRIDFPVLTGSSFGFGRARKSFENKACAGVATQSGKTLASAKDMESGMWHASPASAITYSWNPPISGLPNADPVVTASTRSSGLKRAAAAEPTETMVPAASSPRISE